MGTDQQHPVLEFPNQKTEYSTTYGQGIAVLPSPALHGMNWCFIWCWPCPLASLQRMTQAGGGSTWANNSLTDRQEAETAANQSQPSWKVTGVSPAIQLDGALNHMLPHQPGHSSPCTSYRATHGGRLPKPEDSPSRKDMQHPLPCTSAWVSLFGSIWYSLKIPSPISSALCWTAQYPHEWRT